MGQHYDVMVIGAGPGGYVAAIRAAKLGLHVAVVEEDRAGGTCLNRGCIPAKAMIHAAEAYRSAREADRFGVETGRVSFDYGKILAYKEETTDALVQGVEQLLQGTAWTALPGRGRCLPGRRCGSPRRRRKRCMPRTISSWRQDPNRCFCPSREWIFRECSPATDYFVFRNARRAWPSSAAG